MQADQGVKQSKPAGEDIAHMIDYDNSRARRLLHQAVEKDPKSVQAHVLLARSYLRSLEFEPALKWYRVAIGLDGKNHDALYSAALCQVCLGHYEDAIESYKLAWRATSTPYSLYMCGVLLHRLNRLDQAVRAYDRALALLPADGLDHPLALQGMMAALRDAGRPLTADHYAFELIQLFRRRPRPVTSQLVAIGNSVDFHEWSKYGDKSFLGEALQRRLAIDARGIRIPATFMLPQQRKALEKFATGAPKGTLYIAKPTHGTGGQGISVTHDTASLVGRKDVVVQRYVNPPYLVDGRKQHLRIYGLITSARPLRAYVYTEGIVRFAPETYDASPEKLADVSMHVTNTALHQGHPKLVISRDESKDDEGVIWSLSALLRRMKADGADVDQVFGEIKQIVEWLVRMFDADGLFERQAALGPPRSFGPKLFGMDMLLDAEGHPWLLEIQRKPASTGGALVEKINAELYANIFRMTCGLLIEDGMPPARVAALMGDHTARRQRELDIEAANRGRFVPLSLEA
jgi:Flp pilus assembly protein TadD